MGMCPFGNETPVALERISIMQPIEVPASAFSEHGGELVSEASDLGWRPGFVPYAVTLTGAAPGNGQPFLLDRRRSDHQAFRYAQRFGCMGLVVFND